MGFSNLAHSCICVSLAACTGASVPTVPQPPDPALGRDLFSALCAGCHGDNGDGKSDVATVLSPPPRDLTRGEYRFRSTASGTLPTRADLARTIASGLPGTAMPSWRQQLDDRAIASLVLHVESLSPRFAQEPRLPEDVIVPTDVTSPCATPEAFVQGKSVYEQMRCAECHGDSGRGDGPAAATAMNSDGTPGHVFDFTSGRFKGGKRATDVYRTFMTGLDGSPMPAYDQSVPDEAQRWALVHYVLGLERPRTWRDWLLDRPQWHEP